jgi:transforming growth factor-beta-induced protein
MKTIYKYLGVLTALFTLTITSCEDQDQQFFAEDLDLSGPSLESQIVNEPSLSLFYEAVQAAGLLNILSDNQARTIFAPSNSAFAAYLAQNNYASISEVPQEDLIEIINYYTLPTAITSLSALPSGYLETALSDSRLGISTTDGIFLDGRIEVVEAVLTSSTAIIYVVDGISSPATMTIVERLTALSNDEEEPDYSLFLLALQRAQLDALLASGDYTVLAPTDDAFAAAGIDEATINGLSIEELEIIISYHILDNARFVPDLTSGNVRTLLDDFEEGDKKFPLTITDGDEIGFNRSLSLPQNIQLATNGVIYTLDRVLDFPLTLTSELATYSSVVERESASIFYSGLQAADYLDRFDSLSNSFHLLVPVNLAFGGTSPFPSLSQEQAREIIDRHTFPGSLSLPRSATGARITNIVGESFFVKNDGNGITINGQFGQYGDPSALSTTVLNNGGLSRANAPYRNSAYINGRLSNVNHILTPLPEQSIVEALAANGYDSLVVAIEHAELTETLSSTDSTITVFAPTNQAFVDLLGELEVANIRSIDSDELATILKDHVFSTLYFSIDFQGFLTLQTLNGNDIEVEVGEDVILFSPTGTLQNFELNPVEILSQGGIIHEISTIIMIEE